MKKKLFILIFAVALAVNVITSVGTVKAVTIQNTSKANDCLAGMQSDWATPNASAAFKFNISGITTGGTLSYAKAWFYIYTTAGTPSATLNISRINNLTWSEATSAAGFDAMVKDNQNATALITSVTQDTWGSIVITSMFNVSYAAGAASFSMLINELGYNYDGSSDSVSTGLEIYAGKSTTGPAIDFTSNDGGATVRPFLEIGLIFPDASPTVAANTPVNNTFACASSQGFSFVPSDDDNTTLACHLYVDGVVKASNTSTLNGTNTTLTWSSITGGREHTWFISCIEDGGTGNSSSYNFYSMLPVSSNVNVSGKSVSCANNQTAGFYYNATGVANWTLVMGNFNRSTFFECSYNCSGCDIMSIANKTGYCVLTINQTSKSSGQMVNISEGQAYSGVGPSNLPAALAAGVVGGLVIIYAYTRRRKS